MKPIKRWKLAVCVVGICPLLANGDDAGNVRAGSGDVVLVSSDSTSNPTTRPDHPEASRGGRLFMGQRNPRLEAATAAEWEDASAFMSEHSLERLKFINNLPLDNPRRTSMINVAVREYRNYTRTTVADPELAKIMLSRIELEDSVFSLALQLRRADPTKMNSVKEQLRKKVTDLFDTNMNERKLRISRLKKSLDNEQDSLNRDADQRDKLVDEKYTNILQESQRLNPPYESSHSNSPTTAPTTQRSPGA